MSPELCTRRLSSLVRALLEAQVPDESQHSHLDEQNKIAVPPRKGQNVVGALSDEGLRMNRDANREIDDREAIHEAMPEIGMLDSPPHHPANDSGIGHRHSQHGVE